MSRGKEDSDWKSFLIGVMNKTGVPLEHIANVSKEELNYRVKPQEIAAASFRDEVDLPAEFEFCSREGAIFNTL